MKLAAVPLLLCLLFVGAVLCDTETVEDKKVAKGVFVSCKGCRLKKMPEVKRFFVQSVLKKEYGDNLSVNFKSGAPPVLVLYNAAEEEVERIPVDFMKFDELHELVQKHGFEKVPVTEDATASAATGAAPAATAGTAPAATAGAATTAATEVSDKKVAKGVFVSCKGCRLKRMPEVKRFFVQSVLKKEYGDNLSINFKSGAPPVLVLYNAADQEIERIPVDFMKFDELHELVQKHGFEKVPAAAAAPAATGAAAGECAAKTAAAESTLPPLPSDAVADGTISEL